MPDDLVVLDDDGAAFVRQDDCAVVLEKAQAIVTHEEGRKADISGGNLERPWVGELLSKAGIQI